MERKERLIAAHRRGFIPGDGETEGEFWKRVESSRAQGVYTLFDLRIDWVPVVIGKGIRFWEAGYTEIDQSGATIVLPKKISSLISLDELLQHELVHAVRCGFLETKYEESIAYSLSKRKYRQILGPFFENRITAWIFLGVALLATYVSPYFYAGFIVPSVFHIGKRRSFRRAKRKIEQLFQDDPRKVLLSFSDGDIDFFARHSTPECKEYFRKNSSLRFEQLRLCFDLK